MKVTPASARGVVCGPDGDSKPATILIPIVQQIQAKSMSFNVIVSIQRSCIFTEMLTFRLPILSTTAVPVMAPIKLVTLSARETSLSRRIVLVNLRETHLLTKFNVKILS